MKLNEWIKVLSLIEGIDNECLDELINSKDKNDYDFCGFITLLSNTKHADYFMNISIEDICNAYKLYNKKVE